MKLKKFLMELLEKYGKELTNPLLLKELMDELARRDVRWDAVRKYLVALAVSAAVNIVQIFLGIYW